MRRNISILMTCFIVLIGTLSLSIAAYGAGWVNGTGFPVFPANHNIDFAKNATNPVLIGNDTAMYMAWQESGHIIVKKYDGALWSRIDGGAGLDYNPTIAATGNVSLALDGGTLYAAWTENSGGAAGISIRVKKYSGGTWSFIDPGGSTNPTGLRFSSSPLYPNLMVYDGTLYATWCESNGSYYQIRVAKYTGGTSWVFIDGNSTNGLNVSPYLNGSFPKLTVHDNTLYLCWEEGDGSKKITYLIHVKKYNSTDNTWTLVDGISGYLNYDNTINAHMPSLISFNSVLYATWCEGGGTGEPKSQIRVKSFNGASWSLVDGGAVNGLNLNAAQSGWAPKFIVRNNQLYTTWFESNSESIAQIRVKKYSGGTSWAFVDGNGVSTGGGQSGLNMDPTRNADYPVLAVFNGELYAAWQEGLWAHKQIEVKRYDTTFTMSADAADLSALTLNTGVLMPGFSSDLCKYGVLEQNTVNSIEITPITAASNAIIKVYDNDVTSGSSVTVNLNEGDNTVRIAVIAERSAIIKTYILTVNRIYADGKIRTKAVLENNRDNHGMSQKDEGSFSPQIVAWTGNYVSSDCPNMRTALKFDACFINGNISSTKLYLHNPADSVSTSTPSQDGSPFIDLYASNIDNWLDTDTTFPSTTGSAIAPRISSPIAKNSWVNFDITGFFSNHIATDKYVTIIIQGATEGDNDIAINSKDDPQYAPYLEIVYTPTAGVSSVTAPAKYYKSGDNLDITFTFDRPVMVNTSGGSPYIPVSLNTGGTVSATYNSGASTSTALVFRYTISAGQEDRDGVALGSITIPALSSIRDAVTNLNASLVFLEVDTPGVKVDSIKPANQDTVFHTSMIKKGGAIVTIGSAGETGGSVWFAVAGKNQASDFTIGAAMTTAGGTAESISAPANEGNYYLYVIDAAGNVSTASVAVLTVDNTAPTITSETLVASNKYIDVVLSEGIYGTSTGNGAATETQFSLAFVQNGGTATGASIISVKKPNSEVEASAAALTGGEIKIRVFLLIDGNPSGVETVVIEPVNGTSLYDRAGNPMSALQTTGAINLNPVTLTLLAGILTETNLANTDIRVSLTGTTLKDSSFEAGNFVLTGAPDLRIISGSINYVDSTNCIFRITGSLGGDADMGLTIRGTEISNDYDISTTSANDIHIIDDLPQGKEMLIIGGSGSSGGTSGSDIDNNWYTAESYRNALRTVWNDSSLHLGKGPSGSPADLWLFNPGIIGEAGTKTGQIPGDAKVDRAELVLKIKNISGDQTKPRKISVYQINDTDSLGKPYFVYDSSEGLRNGLDFKYRDHRLGRDIPWRSSGTDSSVSSSIKLLDYFEFIPKAFAEGAYDCVRLDVSEAVKAWVKDRSRNQGLYITLDDPTTVDSTWDVGELVEFYGATAANSANRPKLRVTYLGTGDGYSPYAVSIDIVISGDKAISLTWSSPAPDAGHTAAAGYRVVRKYGVTPADPSDGTLVHDDMTSSINDTGLENGNIYYYAIFTYDASRNYSPKVCTKAVPCLSGRPEDPEDLTCALTGRNVTLSWTDKATNEDEYLVYCDNESNLIKTLTTNQTTYCYRNAMPGPHTFLIRAKNKTGTSNLVSSAPVNVPNLPDVPMDLSWSVISSSEVQLRWTIAADTTYRIEILDADGNLQRTEAATINLSDNTKKFQYPVMRLTAKTSYRFRVVAIKNSLENAVETELVKTTADLKPIFF